MRRGNRVPIVIVGVDRQPVIGIVGERAARNRVQRRGHQRAVAYVVVRVVGHRAVLACRITRDRFEVSR